MQAKVNIKDLLELKLKLLFFNKFLTLSIDNFGRTIYCSNWAIVREKV